MLVDNADMDVTEITAALGHVGCKFVYITELLINFQMNTYVMCRHFDTTTSR